MYALGIGITSPFLLSGSYRVLEKSSLYIYIKFTQGAVAESVEHWSCVGEIVGSSPWSSQPNEL